MVTIAPVATGSVVTQDLPLLHWQLTAVDLRPSFRGAAMDVVALIFIAMYL
jgi:hypothetical protein